ncbi:hypothetical protein EJ03DRAFT_374879 [Teratosphaeria nubilosa]|uniref:EGF-like domain-containing protein n=1 Tax=Teratosphaeria nubilosa TaxID=161662 RepID=A0A6G1L7Z9_9PEZI|nr:hypothetical protein EJ03DRAFT_374879 [Teratosphaeria nubilosa]
MSHQYYDQYGYIPQYPGEHPPPQYYHQQPQQHHQRRMPSPTQQQRRGPSPADAAYGSPPRPQRPIRPDHPSAGVSAGRSRQHAPPHADVDEGLYDGSAYGRPDYVEYDYDHWPLPAPAAPYYQEHRVPSPKQSSPRRPPQRPQRPDAQPSVIDLSRQPARVAPPSAWHQLPPPPPPPPPIHHGSGQWAGEQHSSPSDYPHTQIPLPSQQHAYGQANKRPPLGPPPSARRGPASYYPQVGPVHPIVEETDSMRSSIRTGAVRDSNRSYASSNAIPIGIPDYYLQQQRESPSLAGAERACSQELTSISSEDHPMRPPPASPIHYQEQLRASIKEEPEQSEHERQDSSTDPASLVRQASYGRKSKPVLTMVKSSDRVRRVASREGISGLPSQQRARAASSAMEKEVGYGDGRPSNDSEMDDKHFEAGVAATDVAVSGRVQAPHKQGDNATNTTQSSETLFAGGTGLLDASSTESEKSITNQDLEKKPSKKLLGARIGKRDGSRSRDPSPLGEEADPGRRTSRQIVAGLAAGSALHSKEHVAGRESEELRQPNPGFSARAGKRRPPRLNVDAVRDAEARGSLTSLPDLIKRATRLASNLDRGKTASRLGTNWLEAPEVRHKDSEKRTSGSISDILANFPPPGINGTPPGSRNGFRSSGRGRNRYSRYLPSESDADEGRKHQRARRCCGMPLWLFVILMLLLLALLAAAVVVPVVLVVVPKDDTGGSDSASNKALQTCQSNLKCVNGGANVITATGSCKCVCVNGFTGSTCDTSSEAGCTTASLGNTTDATVGDQIPRLISGASSNFSVPLDGQELLELFSDADLSCVSQNALVAFGVNSKRRIRDILETKPSWTVPVPIAKRQDMASTSEGVRDSTSSSSLGSTTLDFAKVAVLYIFQVSGQLNSAATAQSNLQQFFHAGLNADGQTISVSNVSLVDSYSADLQSYTIDLGNGTSVG